MLKNCLCIGSFNLIPWTSWNYINTLKNASLINCHITTYTCIHRLLPLYHLDENENVHTADSILTVHSACVQ